MTDEDRGDERERFRQAAEFDRHYDRMSWISASILIGASLGATLASTLSPNELALTLIGLFSITTLWIWYFVIETIADLQRNRTRPILGPFFQRPDAWAIDARNLPYLVLARASKALVEVSGRRWYEATCCYCLLTMQRVTRISITFIRK